MGRRAGATMKILAAYDPGSTRAALVIARVDPGAPLALLFRCLYSVGRNVPLPVPIVHPAAGKRGEWTETYKHEVTREEEDAHAGEVFEALLRYGADEVWLESVDSVHGDTAQVVSATARNIGVGERVIASIGTLARRAGIEVQHRARVSWLADIRRHLAAGLTPGVGPLPATVGKGAPFKPLLAAHIPALLEGLDDGTRPGADLRDAGAFLLSRVLECPPPVRARAPSPPRDPNAPRVKRKRRGERAPRKRALMDPEERARLQAAERAKNHEKVLARRVANGCTCPSPRPGRHPRHCPAHRPRRPRNLTP